MSDKVIAMSTEIQNQEKEKNMDSEKNESIVQRMASVLLGALKDATDIVNEYKDTLNQYINNPFNFYAESSIINFKIDLEAPIKIPKYLSSMVFGSEKIVSAIEINGHDVILYFTEKSDIERYTIELDNEKMPVMDLALLVYVLYNLSMNNASLFSLYLKGFKDSITQEKTEILKMLRNNGIELNEINN